MMALQHQWGRVDAEDIILAIENFSKEGRLTLNRTVIMGNSAGGLTALRCLIEHPDTFACGIIAYPVSDLCAMNDTTHVFEKHYNDFLLGALPNAQEQYKQLSPIHDVDKIKTPLLIFQGGEDNVIPQAQTDHLVEELQKLNKPHQYHVYPNEGHGFKRSNNLQHYYQTVLAFIEAHVGPTTTA